MTLFVQLARKIFDQIWFERYESALFDLHDQSMNKISCFNLCVPIRQIWQKNVFKRELHFVIFRLALKTNYKRLRGDKLLTI